MLKKYLKYIYNKIVEIHAEEENFRKFIKNLKALGCNRVLDVGCGYGRNLDILLAHGFDAIGIDVNSYIVQKNVERGLTCFTVEEFASRDNALYDIVLISHVIEHLQPQELVAFLDKYLEYLKPEGYLIITTPLYSPYFYDDFDHVKPYHPTGILMVFGGTQAQVQYYSKNKLELVDLWFRRAPFKNIMVRSRYIKGSLKLFLFADLFWAILFRLSFGYIGLINGWMGLFKKKELS